MAQQDLVDMDHDQDSPDTDTATDPGRLISHKGVWFLLHWFPTQHQFDIVRNFPLLDQDVLIVTFPKSGTTWVQQIVWLILNGVDSRDKRRVIDKFVFLEKEGEISTSENPRMFKSHMPYGCLPSAVKSGRGQVVYVARNAKDVCVSYYHFQRLSYRFGFRGNFSEFYDLFKSGKVAYGPWEDHVACFWNHRHDANVLFLLYEDLHQKHNEMVRKIAEFLGRSLTEDQISAIVQQTKFSVMKDDPTVNYSWAVEQGKYRSNEAAFMRKGIVGDWTNYFTAEMEAEIFKTCTEPLLRQGLQFTERISDSI